MADYPNTSTIFDKAGVTGGTTRAGLSTQIVVYVNGEPVGAIPVSYTHLRAHETPEHRGWRGVG